MHPEKSRAQAAGVSRPAPRTDLLLLGLILLVSLAYLLLYSHAKAIWVDESLTFFTIHHRSLPGLVSFQASTPVVLEPPANDILLWAATLALGYAKLALRLPSMVFFLLTQCLLYRVTRLLGGSRAGLIAALGLLGTLFVNYGAEARPYALLTALTIASLVLWHVAHTDPRRRRLALVGLAVVVAVATTSQFYGAMCVVPVLVAETALCVTERRRPDLPLLLAMGAGLCAVWLDLPFVRAVRPYQPSAAYRVHVGPKQLVLTYEWVFFRQPAWFSRLHLKYSLLIAPLLLIGIAGAFPRRADRHPGTEDLAIRRAIWASLVALVLFPVPALIVAYFVTHYYAPRYAVQCILGIVGLLAVVAARVADRLKLRGNLVLGVLGLALLVTECALMWKDQRSSAAVVLNAYKTSAAARAFLAAHPRAPIFLTVDECILYPFFGDQAYDDRIRCLYSMPLEQHYEHSVLSSLTGEVLTHHTDLPLGSATYQAMRQDRQIILAYAPKPLQLWIPQAIAADGGTRSAIGPGLGGELMLVTLPYHATASAR